MGPGKTRGVRSEPLHPAPRGRSPRLTFVIRISQYPWGQIPTEWDLIEGFCEAGASYEGPLPLPRANPPYHIKKAASNFIVHAVRDPLDAPPDSIVAIPLRKEDMPGWQRVDKSRLLLFTFDCMDTRSRKIFLKKVPSEIPVFATGRWEYLAPHVDWVLIRQGCRSKWPFLTVPIRKKALFVGMLYQKERIEMIEGLDGKVKNIRRGVYGWRLGQVIPQYKIVLDAPNLVMDHYWSNRIYIMTGWGASYLAIERQELKLEFGDSVFWTSKSNIVESALNIIETIGEDEIYEKRESAWKQAHGFHTYRHRAEKWMAKVKEIFF